MSASRIDRVRSTPPGTEAVLISFEVNGWDPRALCSRLADEGFVQRWILDPYCARVSCSFHNTQAEMDRLAHTIDVL